MESIYTGDYSFDELLNPAQEQLETCDARFVQAKRMAVVQLREAGQYDLAVQMLENLMAAQERVHGKEDIDYLRSIFELSCTLLKQYKCTEAEALLRDLLATRRQVLGPTHPHTVNTMSALGDALNHLEKNEEAEELLKESLALVEADIGTENYKYFNTLNNLASVYHSMGNKTEARDLYKQCLDGQLKIKPVNDTSLLNIMDNLAGTYNELDQIDESEALYKRSLTVRVQSWGPEHPETLRAMLCFAEFYENQQRFEDAQVLYERVLAAKERQLGSDHAETHRSRYHVARQEFALENYAEAAKLLEWAMAERQDLSSVTDHQERIDYYLVQQLLALSYQMEDRLEDANAHLEPSLTPLKELLGEGKSPVLRDQVFLGRLRLDQGQPSEALSILRQPLAIMDEKIKKGDDIQRRLGRLYPTCIENIAEGLEKLGDLAEAESTYHKALQFAEEHTGRSSLITGSLCVWLGMWLEGQARWQDAAIQMKRGLDIREEKLGRDHIDTSVPLQALAICADNQDKIDEALPLFRRALLLMERDLGFGHRDTISMTERFCNALHHVGMMDEVSEKIAHCEDNGISYRLVKPVKGETDQEKEEDHAAHNEKNEANKSSKHIRDSSRAPQLYQRMSKM